MTNILFPDRGAKGARGTNLQLYSLKTAETDSYNNQLLTFASRCLEMLENFFLFRFN